MIPFDFYVSIDLGQMVDYSAIAIIEEPVWVDPTEAPAPNPHGWQTLDRLPPMSRRHWRVHAERHGRPPDPPLYLKHLERMRETPYPKVIQRVQRLLATPPLVGANTVLIVDATGVGVAVVDWMVAAGLHPLAVTIHGGDQVLADLSRSTAHVPKRDLIGATQVALQSGRLRLAAGLEHAPTLQDELRSYKVKLSASGRDSYGAREGVHDDLVLAVSMAVWFRGWFCRHLDDAHREGRRVEYDTAWEKAL